MGEERKVAADIPSNCIEETTAKAAGTGVGNTEGVAVSTDVENGVGGAIVGGKLGSLVGVGTVGGMMRPFVGASVGSRVGTDMMALHCLSDVVVGATASHASVAHAVVVAHVLSVVNTMVAPKTVVVGAAD
jgi:hypothetical protein